MDPGKAFKLKELVPYADGTVISRTLKKDQSGTLTVFAFAEGESLSEHKAPFDAFVQVLDGEGEIVVDGKPVAVTEGEIILMPANITHAVNARKPFKMLLMMIRG
ncbi:MAG: cupin [Candidatus Hydrogenedentes bacterium CG1_02_42_14]|nr:MAG: cupin [Candidatus Hydrogenedentes bacterium CG1_02_42_14]